MRVLARGGQLAFALELCAGSAAAQGQRQEQTQPGGLQPARLFGAAEALREMLRAPAMSFQPECIQRGLAAARAQLDDATFATA